MRMIDADALVEEIESYNGDIFASEIVDLIKQFPTADAPDTNVGKWIPCSERLPDKKMCTDEDGLVTVETTEILPNGEHCVFIEDFMLDVREFCTPYEVIAWRERPEPYQLEGGKL